MSGEVLLLDGDIIRYRCAFSAEKTYYLVFDGDNYYEEFDNAKEAKAFSHNPNKPEQFVWSRKEIQPVEFALQATKTTIESILEKFPSRDSYRLYLSGPTNFRDKIAYTRKYKGDRPPKPKYYKEVGEFLVQNYGAKYTDGEEADDIIARDAASIGERAMVISTDKDLRQVSGNHFNWVTGEYCKVSKREAAFNFWSQVLTGDITDNVPGLDGIGPKTANLILDGARNSKELEERVRKAYRDNGKSEDYFKEQVSLIKIGERFNHVA